MRVYDTTLSDINILRTLIERRRQFFNLNKTIVDLDYKLYNMSTSKTVKYFHFDWGKKIDLLGGREG